MNLRFVFLTSIFWVLGFLAFSLERSSLVLLLPIFISSLIFFVYYIFSEGLWEEIAGNVLMGVCVLVLACIPIVGWLVFAIWVLYNISMSVEGIKALLPDAIFSFFVYVLLFSKNIFSLPNDVEWMPFAVYAIATICYAKNLSYLSLKSAFFKMSMMWMSLFLIVLMISAIFASIRSLFNFSFSRVSSSAMSSQSVSGYTKANGTVVGGYTRSVLTPIEVTKVSFRPDVGSLGLGMRVDELASDEFSDHQAYKNKKYNGFKSWRWAAFGAVGLIGVLLLVVVDDEISLSVHNKEEVMSKNEKTTDQPNKMTETQPLAISTALAPREQDVEINAPEFIDETERSEHVIADDQVSINADTVEPVLAVDQPSPVHITEPPLPVDPPKNQPKHAVTDSSPVKTRRQLDDEATARVAEENARKMAQGLLVSPQYTQSRDTNSLSDAEATARVVEANARKMADGMYRFNQSLEQSSK